MMFQINSWHSRLYFPNSKFFTNESKIIKYIEESNLNYKTKIDYMVICTPNYLHESQIDLV